MPAKTNPPNDNICNGYDAEHCKYPGVVRPEKIPSDCLTNISAMRELLMTGAYSICDGGDNYERKPKYYLSIRKKYDSVIPRLWRDDECSMLTENGCSWPYRDVSVNTKKSTAGCDHDLTERGAAKMWHPYHAILTVLADEFKRDYTLGVPADELKHMWISDGDMDNATSITNIQLYATDIPWREDILILECDHGNAGRGVFRRSHDCGNWFQQRESYLTSTAQHKKILDADINDITPEQIGELLAYDRLPNNVTLAHKNTTLIQMLMSSSHLQKDYSSNDYKEFIRTAVNIAYHKRGSMFTAPRLNSMLDKCRNAIPDLKNRTINPMLLYKYIALLDSVELYQGGGVKESRDMWETVIAEIDAMISEPNRLLYVLND